MEERIRDRMVFLMTSLTGMLETVTWTVYSGYKLPAEVKRLDTLCGYVLTYYGEDEKATDIYFSPGIKGKKLFIRCSVNDTLQDFELSLESSNPDTEEWIPIHEFIRSICLEKVIILDTSCGRFMATKYVNPEWTRYDKVLAISHLSNFGVIFVEPEYSTPIDDEYYYDELETEYKKKVEEMACTK